MDMEHPKDEIEDVIGLEAQDAPRISAKTGLNVEEVLEQIVHKLPAPKGDVNAPLKALIFDYLYDWIVLRIGHVQGLCMECINFGGINRGLFVGFFAHGDGFELDN